MHPVFWKYTRGWLSAQTGYSRAYLSRVATGNVALSHYFIERVAFSLREHPSQLFLPEALKRSDRRQHQKKNAKEAS